VNETRRPGKDAGAGSDPGRVSWRLRLKAGRERSLLLHHPWVFDGAVADVEALAGAEAGAVGDVVAQDGSFLARGTVHPDSAIMVRVLAWEQRPIDLDLFVERIDRAVSFRRSLFDESRTDCWRAVNAEGDELPGLVVDRYGSVVVTQTLTSGMLRLRPFWLEAIRRVLGPETVLERGEKARRESVEESGAPAEPLLGPAITGVREVRENGLRFLVDLASGQKTGFYLDQRENRASVGARARGAEALNLFGYTGSFSVAAGAGGARRVLQVESSAPARGLARTNWERNGLDPAALELSGEDVFQFLRADTRSWDLLVLDPPPFARERGSVERASRAYKDLHLWSLCRARPGALIWSFCCSQQVDADLFQKIVFGAARDAGASVQWLSRLGPGPDHPVHLDHPQGEYLKGLLMRVLRPGTPPRPAAERRGAGAPLPGRAEPADRPRPGTTAGNTGAGKPRGGKVSEG
jgi:23S rRNA (cytosine1962-C5)-methyltransferase